MSRDANNKNIERNAVTLQTLLYFIFNINMLYGEAWNYGDYILKYISEYNKVPLVWRCPVKCSFCKLFFRFSLFEALGSFFCQSQPDNKKN